MSERDDHHLSPERRQRLKGKLDRLLDWTCPKIEKTIGPYLPNAFDEFEAARLALVESCRARLASYTDEQGEEISQLPQNQSQDAHGWRKFLSEEVRLLERSEPHWFAGGFGHPDHVADFDYWTKMRFFNIAELTCLTVGIAPKEYSLTVLHDLTSSKDRRNFGPVLEFLVQRYEQLQRALGQGRGNTSVDPRTFLAWATRFDFAVHPGFLVPLQKFHQDVPVLGAIQPQKQDKREVDKISQLFTAMAIDQLGYVPDQARSPVPKEIGEIAASMGLQITDETIRNHLRRGATFIPNGWKPKGR